MVPTMMRPGFDGLRVRWSDDELAAWIGVTERHAKELPWRLQWLESARVAMLLRRAAAEAEAGVVA